MNDKLKKQIEDGFRADPDHETEVAVGVTLKVVINLALDPGGRLAGRELKQALLDNALETLEAHTHGVQSQVALFDSLVDAVEVVDAHRTDQGPPPVRVDVLAHAKEEQA